MPDFLDSLISQVKETAPVLRPRTPGLFEPVPGGYGPGGRLDPARIFTAAGLQDLPEEELETLRSGAQGASRPADEVELPDSKRPQVKSRLRKPRLSESEQRIQRAADAAALKPVSPAGVTARLHELEVLKRAEPPVAPTSPVRHTFTVEQDQPSPRLPRRLPEAVSDRHETLRPVPAQAAGQESAGDFHGLHDTAERLGELAPEPTLSRLKRLENVLEYLRLQAANAPPAQQTPTPPFRPAALQSPPEGSRSSAAAGPLLIQVNIGRVEVRAAPSAAPTPSRANNGRGSSPSSLDDYLRRRNGGSV